MTDTPTPAQEAYAAIQRAQDNHAGAELTLAGETRGWGIRDQALKLEREARDE